MHYRHIINLSFFTFIWGFVGYIFHPLMMKLLSDQHFVQLEFVMSMTGIMGTIFGWLGMFVNKEITRIGNNQIKQYTLLYVFVRGYMRLMPYIFAGLILLWWLIWRYFQTIDYMLIMYNMSLVMLAWFGALIDGLAKARQYYRMININTVMGHVLKIIIWGILVYIGAGVWWASTWLLCAGIILFGYNVRTVYTWYPDKHIDLHFAHQLNQDFFQIRTDLIINTILIVLLAILLNIDIMLASKVLAPDQATIYASISVIAKFVFFVAGSVETVYYTYLVANPKIDLKLYVKPLWWYVLILVWGLSAIFVLGFYVLENFKIWLGSYTPVLANLFVYFLVVAIVSLYSKLLIAHRHIMILIWLTMMIVSMIVWLEWWAYDLYSFVNILSIVMIVMIIMIGVWLYIYSQDSF